MIFKRPRYRLHAVGARAFLAPRADPVSRQVPSATKMRTRLNEPGRTCRRVDVPEPCGQIRKSALQTSHHHCLLPESVLQLLFQDLLLVNLRLQGVHLVAHHNVFRTVRNPRDDGGLEELPRSVLAVWSIHKGCAEQTDKARSVVLQVAIRAVWFVRLQGIAPRARAACLVVASTTHYSLRLRHGFATYRTCHSESTRCLVFGVWCLVFGVWCL